MMNKFYKLKHNSGRSFLCYCDVSHYDPMWGFNRVIKEL